MSGAEDTSATERIFLAALPLSATERLAYLSQACGDNQPLRERIEALLQADAAPHGFLPEEHGPPPADLSLPVPLDRSLSAQEEEAEEGARIGRYRLVQR